MSFSGFDKDGKLNLKSYYFKYHVESHDYGVVESAFEGYTLYPRRKEIRGVGKV